MSDSDEIWWWGIRWYLIVLLMHRKFWPLFIGPSIYNLHVHFMSSTYVLLQCCCIFDLEIKMAGEKPMKFYKIQLIPRIDVLIPNNRQNFLCVWRTVRYHLMRHCQISSDAYSVDFRNEIWLLSDVLDVVKRYLMVLLTRWKFWPLHNICMYISSY